MKVLSRMHQLTEMREDAWIFRGDRPQRVVRFAYRTLDLFNAVAIAAAVALLLVALAGMLLP